MAVDIEKLKNSVSLSEVVSQRIEIKKNGHEFIGCCPFHAENTPSFTIFAGDRRFYCFGCGAGGDVIDFVMRYENVNLITAAEILTGKDHITQERIEQRKPIKKQADYYERYKPRTTSKRLKAGQGIEVINPKREHQRVTWRPVAVYPYEVLNGDVFGYVVRMEFPGDDGRLRKITPMLRWCGEDVGWVAYPFGESLRPLYGLLNLIKSTAQVIVVEGEKTRDHLQAVLPERPVVTWSGGTNAVTQTDWGQLQGREVIIIPDNDEVGFKAAGQVAYEAFNVGAKSVRFVIPPPDLPEHWDVADQAWEHDQFIQWARDHIGALPAEFHVEPKPEPEPPPPNANNPIEAIDVSEEPNHDWRHELIYSDGRKLKSNLSNARVLLEYHPDMAGVLGFNQFAKSVDILSKPPWDRHPCEYPRAISDVDATNAAIWLERKGIEKNTNSIHSAMVAVAHYHSYNPLVDYLESVQWDGQQRLDEALIHLLGCDDNDYVRAITRKFLIGSVARALNPGCKFDTVLILEGDQGLKKSTAIAELYGLQWFTDELGDFGSKDAAMQIQGRWCVEIAELATLSRAETNKANEWITRRVDRFRPPYGRAVIEAPRQCVLIGTVNPQGGYLKDPTGGRRYWPVFCRDIRIDWIKARRDQLWAEAVHAYRAGETWWFERDEYHLVQGEQSARYEGDAWDEPVQKYIAYLDKVTSYEIMERCLGLAERDKNKMAEVRVKQILVSNGFERRQRRIDGRPQWVYVRRGTSE